MRVRETSRIFRVDMGLDFNFASPMLRGLLVIATVALSVVAYAQNSKLAGDYAGMLGPYQVKLHLVAGPNGKLTGTTDNSTAGLFGLTCEDIRLNGQTLSFTVPAVHGTWTGFVSADGESLSGMYSQQGASPVPLNLTRSSSGSQATASSGSADPNAPRDVKWDDYVFKFMPGGNVAQVYQGGTLVGTIVTVNGEPQVTALPGTDSAKLQKSYRDYQTFNARSHGEAPTTTATGGSNAGSQHPPCSTMPGVVSYWDGSDWKVMVAASHMGYNEGLSWKRKAEGGALFHPLAGTTQIVTFKNSAAALALGPKPSFCLYVLPSSDPSVIMIGRLDVKRNHRQLETCTGACAMSAKRSTDDWMPEDRVQPVDIKRLSDTTVEITPKEPLQPGQYLLGGPSLAVAYYDFSVAEGSSK